MDTSLPALLGPSRQTDTVSPIWPGMSGSGAAIGLARHTPQACGRTRRDHVLGVLGCSEADRISATDHTATAIAWRQEAPTRRIAHQATWASAAQRTGDTSGTTHVQRRAIDHTSARRTNNSRMLHLAPRLEMLQTERGSFQWRASRPVLLNTVPLYACGFSCREDRRNVKNTLTDLRIRRRRSRRHVLQMDQWTATCIVLDDRHRVELAELDPVNVRRKPHEVSITALRLVRGRPAMPRCQTSRARCPRTRQSVLRDSPSQQPPQAYRRNHEAAPARVASGTSTRRPLVTS